MKFKLPTASRKRLEELLEYLGDRAGDFRKCFDVESPWCWEYADLVIRGLNKKSGSYIETHHIIPIAYYLPGNTRKLKHRFTAKYTIRNVTGLDCAEHIKAHYCMVRCANGDPNVHAMAFIFLYRIYKNGCRKREHDAIAPFSDETVFEILGMLSTVRKVTEEGRRHKFDDKKGYQQDWREANIELVNGYKQDWREANIERIRAYDRERNSGSRRGYMKEYLAIYWKTKKPKLQKYRKDWVKKNEAHVKQYQHDRYTEHHDEIRAQQKAYREAKRAAGFRWRKDPETGKYRWIFVGLPATPETPKSTSGAA